VDPPTRAYYSRPGLRDGSDLTDAEWAILALFMLRPLLAGANSGGTAPDLQRNLLHAAVRLRVGDAARQFPPPSTVYRCSPGSATTVRNHQSFLSLYAIVSGLAVTQALRPR
jgi:hypothetical protein